MASDFSIGYNIAAVTLPTLIGALTLTSTVTSIPIKEAGLFGLQTMVFYRTQRLCSEGSMNWNALKKGLYNNFYPNALLFSKMLLKTAQFALAMWMAIKLQPLFIESTLSTSHIMILGVTMILSLQVMNLGIF